MACQRSRDLCDPSQHPVLPAWRLAGLRNRLRVSLNLPVPSSMLLLGRSVTGRGVQGRKRPDRLQQVAAWAAGLQQVLTLLGLWAGPPQEQLVHMQRLALARCARASSMCFPAACPRPWDPWPDRLASAVRWTPPEPQTVGVLELDTDPAALAVWRSGRKLLSPCVGSRCRCQGLVLLALLSSCAGHACTQPNAILRNGGAELACMCAVAARLVGRC